MRMKKTQNRRKSRRKPESLRLRLAQRCETTSRPSSVHHSVFFTQAALDDESGEDFGAEMDNISDVDDPESDSAKVLLFREFFRMLSLTPIYSRNLYPSQSVKPNLRAEQRVQRVLRVVLELGQRRPRKSSMTMTTNKSPASTDRFSRSGFPVIRLSKLCRSTGLSNSPPDPVYSKLSKNFCDAPI